MDSSVHTAQSERILLLDQQENAVTHESYFHIAKEIVNAEGVQNGSRVLLQYDPAFQSLGIHFVRVIREGKVIDRLEPEKFKIIQQETGLERHMFDGELSAVLFLEDVRIGDVIEYACTVKGSNPILQDHFVKSLVVEWSVPMDQEVLRLIWPSNKELTIKNHKTTVQPEIRKLGALTEYTWNLSQVPPVVYEAAAPTWIEKAGWIQLTDFSSWREVSDWALPLYQHGHPELSDELRKKIVMWEAVNTPEERVLQALRFVQDEVRYLGIEIGPNSQKPNAPGLVFARRFGDCKDKVNLFCSLLTEMGIEAHPVLVNTYWRKTAMDWAPSPYTFNHAVAQVMLNGQVFWFDPTLSYQRGTVTNLFFPDYGCGLVLTPETTNVSAIPTQTTGTPLTSVYDTFHSFSYTNPVSYEVRIIKRGADADDTRALLAKTTADILQKSYLNYFARIYPKIKVAIPIEIKDDEEKNELAIIQNFQIADVWELSEDKRKWALTLHAWDLDDFMRVPDTPIRTLPISVIHPEHRKQVTSFNFTGPANFKPASIHVDNPAFHFDRQVDFSQGKLTITSTFNTLTNVVSAADAPEYISALKQAREKLFYSIERPVKSAAGTISQPNWLVLALASLYSLVMIAAVAAAYHFRPRNKYPPPINPDPALIGLGGWLILLGINLVLRPFYLLSILIKSSALFSTAGWTLVTTPGSANYHPGLAPLLLVELLGNLTLLAFSILLLVFFFQKRYAFPRLGIPYLLFSVSVVIADHLATQCIIPTHSTTPASGERFITTMIGTVIWIFYLVKSERVKLTFVR